MEKSPASGGGKIQPQRRILDSQRLPQTVGRAQDVTTALAGVNE